MNNKILIYLAFLIIALVGCDKTRHQIIPQDPTKDAVLKVTMTNHNVAKLPLRNVQLHIFDQTDRLYKELYYASMEELAMDRIVLPIGSYTTIVVVNMDRGVSFKNGDSMADFARIIKEDQPTYPDMATGTMRHIIKEGEQLLYIDLKPKATGIEDGVVELLLTIPSPRLPDFTSTKVNESVALRGLAHIYKKGSNDLYAMTSGMLKPTKVEGVYSMQLYIFAGEYDVNLFVDYSAEKLGDNHYVRSEGVIDIVDKTQYRANTDTRDAFEKRFSLTALENDTPPINVVMNRPLAKYRIVATDVQQYEVKRLEKGYPPVDKLQIFIGYEGFLPSSYSIVEGRPCDAKEGYFYYSALSQIEQQMVTVAKDYIFADGQESAVFVTILFKDEKGNTISGVKGVKIDYRIGQLTTISGEFLTAGLNNSIEIDTSWEGEYDVEF